MSLSCSTRYLAGSCLFLGMALVLPSDGVHGQGLKKSDNVVKVTAKADKPDGDGKQVVTITLEHDKGWHSYANPVGNEDLASAQTTIAIAAKEKIEDVKVEFPAGKVIKDKVVGDYKVWEDKVAIKATVKRAKGDTSPLDITVKFQVCNDKTCLIPAAVKLTAP